MMWQTTIGHAKGAAYIGVGAKSKLKRAWTLEAYEEVFRNGVGRTRKGHKVMRTRVPSCGEARALITSKTIWRRAVM